RASSACSMLCSRRYGCLSPSARIRASRPCSAARSCSPPPSGAWRRNSGGSEGFRGELMDERFALVTGAGSGIGKASALALARTGWHVALAGRRREPLEEVAGEIKALGRRALSLPTNVADPEAVKALFAAIEREFGPSTSCSTMRA